MSEEVKTTELKEEFRTTNHVLDEATFNEVKKYLFPILKQKTLIMITLIAILLGFWLFLIDKYALGMVLILLGVVFFLDALTARSRAVRKAIKQIRQITGKDYCTYNYTLTDKDIFVRCVETNMNEHIPYEKITRCTETVNAIVLFTKESRMVIFRKNALSEKERRRFAEIVNERCENMEYFKHK